MQGIPEYKDTGVLSLMEKASMAYGFEFFEWQMGMAKNLWISFPISLGNRPPVISRICRYSPAFETPPQRRANKWLRLHGNCYDGLRFQGDGRVRFKLTPMTQTITL